MLKERKVIRISNPREVTTVRTDKYAMANMTGREYRIAAFVRRFAIILRDEDGGLSWSFEHGGIKITGTSGLSYDDTIGSDDWRYREYKMDLVYWQVHEKLSSIIASAVYINSKL